MAHLLPESVLPIGGGGFMKQSLVPGALIGVLLLVTGPATMRTLSLAAQQRSTAHPTEQPKPQPPPPRSGTTTPAPQPAPAPAPPRSNGAADHPSTPPASTGVPELKRRKP